LLLYNGSMGKKEKTMVLTRIVKVTERTCPTCGNKFEGWGKQKFCSKLCANKDAYDRNADTYRANRRRKYHADKTNDSTRQTAINV